MLFGPSTGRFLHLALEQRGLFTPLFLFSVCVIFSLRAGRRQKKTFPKRLSGRLAVSDGKVATSFLSASDASLPNICQFFKQVKVGSLLIILFNLYQTPFIYTPLPQSVRHIASSCRSPNAQQLTHIPVVPEVDFAKRPLKPQHYSCQLKIVLTSSWIPYFSLPLFPHPLTMSQQNYQPKWCL